MRSMGRGCPLWLAPSKPRLCRGHNLVNTKSGGGVCNLDQFAYLIGPHYPSTILRMVPLPTLRVGRI